MIDPESRFFCLSGDLRSGGPTTWYVTDWDQRRIISVTMDGEVEDDEIAIEHLRRHVDQIASTVHRIYVSPAGEILSSWSDGENDPTYCVHYPLVSESHLPDGVRTVRRDELEELDRLGPDVDLVQYPASRPLSARKDVFKYYHMWEYAERCWVEMNLWMRLPRHPNIVAFDAVVLDELHPEGRVIGFTNEYIPGGTLEETKTRVFKLKWLRQLLNVVDFLFEWGIAHQDVAPRNLLVDEATDSIKLFDFNFAARLNPVTRHPREGFVEERNDVKGVIFTTYELITRDDSLRSRPHEEQRLDDLGGEWKQHPEVKLERPLEEYRSMLLEWQKKSLAREQPSGGIDWPARPAPPTEVIHRTDLQVNPVSCTREVQWKLRKDLQMSGGDVLNWERPPQGSLGQHTRLLSTGEFTKDKAV